MVAKHIKSVTWVLGDEVVKTDSKEFFFAFDAPTVDMLTLLVEDTAGHVGVVEKRLIVVSN